MDNELAVQLIVDLQQFARHALQKVGLKQSEKIIILGKVMDFQKELFCSDWKYGNGETFTETQDNIISDAFDATTVLHREI